MNRKRAGIQAWNNSLNLHRAIQRCIENSLAQLDPLYAQSRPHGVPIGNGAFLVGRGIDFCIVYSLMANRVGKEVPDAVHYEQAFRHFPV